MPDTGSGTTPGRQSLLGQAASANALCGPAGTVRLAAALVFLRRMVCEIIVAFLGTLPLDRHPESKPFTPSVPPARRSYQDNASGPADHPRTTDRARRGRT